MPELECQTLCLGMGIHYPYYVDTGSNLLKPLQKEDQLLLSLSKDGFSGISAKSVPSCHGMRINVARFGRVPLF